jgi:hypothetical protein
MEVVEMSTDTTTRDARHDVVNRARTSRLREHLAHLDSLRALAEASALGVTQSTLASELRVTQPTISSALKTARTTPQLLEGFHGATPYEVAQRYAAGDLTRAQLVDELTRWPYAAMPSTDGRDDLLDVPAGTADDVRRALSDGLIDAVTYDEILDAVEAYRGAVSDAR